MIIILGLIILVAALVVAVAGIMGNGGSAHAVSHFSVLGYHLTGSAGTLFLAGIVVGAAGLLGLSLLLAGARRRRRRGSAATRRLRQSRRETAAVTQERDDLIGQRDTARADTVDNLRDGNPPLDDSLRPAGDRWSRLRGLGNRFAPAQASAQPGVLAGQPAAEVPASASDPDVAVMSPALDAHADEPAAAG
jgi:uncharacterized membrane protein YciS (DUF1049 family)